MANKGYAFEKETVERLKKRFGEQTAFRVYGSGRNKLSKNLSKDVDLEGDVMLELPLSKLLFQLECKHYKDKEGKKGKERSIRILKDWLDTNLDESERKGAKSIVAIKFKYTSDNAVHYIVPEEHFLILLEIVEKLQKSKVIREDLKGKSNEELINEISWRLKEKKE